MAKIDNTQHVAIVTDGDTLWDIAKELLPAGATNQQIKKKVNQLAALNRLPNEDFLVIDQELKLTPDTTPAKAPSGYITFISFGRLSPASDNKVYASWSFPFSADAESYKIEWTYTNLSGQKFVEAEENRIDEDIPNASTYAFFSIPSGAVKITCRVKPIAKKNDDGSKTDKFTAKWSDTKTYNVSTPLEIPPAPSVKLEGQKLTAELSNLDIVADSIAFRLVKNNTKVVETTKGVAINKTTKYVAKTWSSVETGCEYAVQCRAIKGSLTSEWSELSENKATAPETPGAITTCKATDETTVYLSWGASKSADSYEIEYTTDRKYFDASGETKRVSVEKGTAYYITNMESGKEYFFRVRAKNDGGESKWTGIVSVILGKEPSAPTTWSSSTTAIVGETVVLYWVHNSEDGSSETYAQLSLSINGATPKIIDIQNTDTDADIDNIKSYEFDTSSYSEGTTLAWRVRTRGVINKFSEWSTERTVDIYAKPTLRLSIKDGSDTVTEIASFPFYVSAVPGPDTQAPIAYHVSITSEEMYETVDTIGNPVVVNVGEEVYSKFFDTNMDLNVMLSAGDVDLERNIRYTITCVVTMNSGLTAEASVTLPVTWSEIIYTPNARIGVDEDAYTAYITPYCADQYPVYRKVNLVNGKYILTDEELDFVCPYTESNLQLRGVYTTTGERVQKGFDGNADIPASGDVETIYFCEVLKSIPVESVTLSVYRREFDGRFTEIATGINSSGSTTVTDPHPALDYARYRIVATSSETGAVGYYDMPAYYVGGKSAVIQWDEAWTSFDTVEDGNLEQPPWSGSLLKLPYNIDVSDKHRMDVSLIEYIGRSHPVSYYGTHLGETSTWSMVIDKSDKETLYALRRLAIWTGDVYVREPSGSGYWANVSVSFNQKHKSVTIPVTLEITRVEGGT